MKKKNKAREKKEVLANLSILYCIGSVDWYLLYLSLNRYKCPWNVPIKILACKKKNQVFSSI